jgi:hypothetical protein
MAKKSMVNREIKRAALAKKFAKKRAALKAVITDEGRSYEERVCGCRSCRGTRARCVAATVAASLAARTATTASSVWAVTNCVGSPCRGMYPAWSRPAGKRELRN